MSNIEQTLTERGERYGDFAEHARIAQGLKDIMWNEAGWSRLTPAMRQSLEVIADKIARILNGDPTYADNWHDIQGYAQLVEKTLQPQDAMELYGIEARAIFGDALIDGMKDTCDRIQTEFVRKHAKDAIRFARSRPATSNAERRIHAHELASTAAVKEYILENFGELDMELEAEEAAAQVQD